MDDTDECTRKDLVAVEEEIIAEPSTSGGHQAVPVVRAYESEGLSIVPGDIRAFLGSVNHSISVCMRVNTIEVE